MHEAGSGVKAFGRYPATEVGAPPRSPQVTRGRGGIWAFHRPHSGNAHEISQ
jgi:hypothetical protein